MEKRTQDEKTRKTCAVQSSPETMFDPQPFWKMCGGLESNHLFIIWLVGKSQPKTLTIVDRKCLVFGKSSLSANMIYCNGYCCNLGVAPWLSKPPLRNPPADRASRDERSLQRACSPSSSRPEIPVCWCQFTPWKYMKMVYDNPMKIIKNHHKTMVV